MSKARDLAALGAVAGQGYLFRNRVINGSMAIDQRNAGASVSLTNGGTVFSVDRNQTTRGGWSTLTASLQQVLDAPTGFKYSSKITIGTGEATPAAASLVAADHRIEGYNFADFAFGTSAAQSATLSFWVKASIAGTYPVSFFNASVDRSYLATYVVNSANTWEYKTITIPGCTDGTWNTTNGIGLGWQFDVGSGSNANGTAGTWNNVYKPRTSGCVQIGATSGATWQITGMQLEKGTVATPFEFRPYGTEFALCQRYFQYGSNSYYQAGASAVRYLAGNFVCPMRATPTCTITGTIVSGSESGTTISPINNLSYFMNQPSSTIAIGGYFTAVAEL